MVHLLKPSKDHFCKSGIGVNPLLFTEAALHNKTACAGNPLRRDMQIGILSSHHSLPLSRTTNRNIAIRMTSISVPPHLHSLALEQARLQRPRRARLQSSDAFPHTPT